MQTKNFRDLSSLPVESYIDPIELAKRKYKEAINHQRVQINRHMEEFYGVRIEVPEKYTSDTLARIKQVIHITGATMKQLAFDIRGYLGYNAEFFRQEGSKKVPINSTRIIQAYKAILEKKPISEIETILYK